MFLYQIPRNHWELLEGKKPSSKICFGDVRVWLVTRDWVAVMVSAEVEIVGKKVSKVKEEKR